jgi:hypothetical protein
MPSTGERLGRRSEQTPKVIHPLVDEGHERVLLIAAAILAATQARSVRRRNKGSGNDQRHCARNPMSRQIMSDIDQSLSTISDC